MAEQLKTVGYATGIIRQWHLGYPQNSEDDHPQNHGFNEFIGYDRGNIDFVSPVGDHLPHDWWHGRVNPPEESDATDLINRYAVEFIDRHYDRPFCRYVPHLAIHNRGRCGTTRRSERNRRGNAAGRPTIRSASKISRHAAAARRRGWANPPSVAKARDRPPPLMLSLADTLPPPIQFPSNN